MYCRNCGKEVLETDKFCATCGHSNEVASDVITEVKPDIKSQPKVSYVKQNNTLPMNWWKFWQYFRFPVGIIMTVVNIMNYLPELEVNAITIFALLTDISIVILMFVTYYHFLDQDKIGYKFMIAWLIIELTFNALNVATTSLSDYSNITLMDFAGSFIFAICILGLAWTLPNYIYFKKRKHCFNDENKDE